MKNTFTGKLISGKMLVVAAVAVARGSFVFTSN